MGEQDPGRGRVQLLQYIQTKIGGKETGAPSALAEGAERTGGEGYQQRVSWTRPGVQRKQRSSLSPRRTPGQSRGSRALRSDSTRWPRCSVRRCNRRGAARSARFGKDGWWFWLARVCRRRGPGPACSSGRCGKLAQEWSWPGGRSSPVGSAGGQHKRLWGE